MERVERVIRTLEATKDLEDTFTFYSEKSVSAAARIVERIIEKVEDSKFLKQHQADEFNPKYRRAFGGHYRIV
jgi:hypothetical protein